MRYIDADALLKSMQRRYDEICDTYGYHDLYASGYDDAVDAVENAPTADVEPRAEVNEAYWEGVEYGNKDGAALVAMEIFEEIEKHLFVIAPIEEFDGWARIQLADIMRLKKKYTQSEPPKGD